MKSATVLGTVGLAGLAAMSIQVAAAAESGWYAGFNLGRAEANIDGARVGDDLRQSGLDMTAIDEDDEDFGYKFFGGYKLNRNFAVEGGYFNLGEFGYTATTSPPGTATGNIKLSGFNLDALGILPLTDKFSLFGRIGVQYAKAKDSFSGTGAAAGDSSASKSAANYKAGVGLQYDFTDNLGLRTEWERYRINDAVGNRGDIDMISVGLVFSFGGAKQSSTSQADTYKQAEPVHEPAASPEPAQRAAEPEPIVAAAPAQAAEPEPVAPQPAAAAAPAPYVAEPPIVVVVPAPARTQQYCSILDIQFEINNDTIQREEREKVDRVGNFMRKYPDTNAVIEGHTDNVGKAADNMTLSLRRAQSVVSYLEKNFAIAPSRLKAVGYGDTMPVADTQSEEGRRLNRRIDAVIACATDIAGLTPPPGRITMALDMQFDANKDTVRPQYREELRKVADFMNAHPGVTATVEGHTGNLQATAKLAQEISQRRAQNVVNYLVDNFGIARSRLSAEGFGRTRRFAYNTSAEGRQENRRVNIIFNYPK